MSVKTVFRAVDKDAIEFSLTVTMTMSEWKELQEQLPRSYPSFRLANAVRDMVTKANTHWTEEIETETP